MLELQDSSGLTQDGLAARLRTDGYVFLRGLLPAEDVLRVRSAVVSVLAEERWTAPGTDPELLLPGPSACLEAADGYFDAYRRIIALQQLNELAHHPALTSVTGSLVGGPLLVHPRKIGRAGQPQAGEYTLPHQDFRLVQGSVDTLTAWIPLGSAPIALGGLKVAQGSCAAGLLPVKHANGPGNMAIDGPVPGTWASCDYQVGDVIVFHSLTVHGAMPNRTDSMRLSVDFRYQRADEPVHTGSLHPHYVGHPSIPDWDELCSDWSCRDAIAIPSGVREVTAFHDAWDPLMPVPAPRLVDVTALPEHQCP